MHIKKDKFYAAAWKTWFETTKTEKWKDADLPFYDKSPFKPERKEHLIRMNLPRASLLEIAANRCVDDMHYLFIQEVAQGMNYQGSVPFAATQVLGMVSKLHSRIEYTCSHSDTDFTDVFRQSHLVVENVDEWNSLFSARVCVHIPRIGCWTP